MHHLGMLVHLEELNVAKNQLKMLPHNLNRLVKLRKFRASHNRLISMAILPRIKDEDLKPVLKFDPNAKGQRLRDWIVQEDPITKEAVYYNKVTSDITRRKPQAFIEEEKKEKQRQEERQDIPSLSLDQLKHGSIQMEVKPIERRLSQRDPSTISEGRKYPGGWEIKSVDGYIEYYNRIMREHFTTYVLNRQKEIDYDF